LKIGFRAIKKKGKRHMTQNNRIQALVHSGTFERVAVAVIVINAILTGVQVSHNTADISLVQMAILWFFVAEIILRFVGRTSTKEYLMDGWNYFDVFVVAISFVPEDMMGGANVSVLRSLRVLRVFRILRGVEELRLITSVLLKSVKSLGYSGILFFIFMYVYAVIGVSLFKAGNFTKGPEWSGNPQWIDPYGSIGEAMFTLFRVMTGEDWTDLRYNLLQLVPNLDSFVTFYHVSWMILSAFLLINLVVGAIVNNYDRTMEEVKAEENLALKTEDK
jgi:voltage-gated sodium channel